VLVVNTADKTMTTEGEQTEQPQPEQQEEEEEAEEEGGMLQSESGGGGLQLVACNSSGRPSQHWALSPGVKPDSGAITNVMPAATAALNGSAGQECWSIHACGKTVMMAFCCCYRPP
jgi:hypothetical protein